MIKAGVVSNSGLCLPLLQYLKQQGHEVKFYLGLRDAAVDVSAVLAFCNTNRIAVETEKLPEQLYGWLKMHKPDFVFIFCYKALVDVSRLGAFKEKMFNIHPGKLPQYRGPTPVFWQLKNGEKKLGLAIHYLSNKYDGGEIVWSKEINNEAHFSHGLVDVVLSNILIEGVHFIMQVGIDVLQKTKMVQDGRIAATYKKPVLKDVLINWQAMEAGVVVNLVKACNPWNKGAMAMLNNMEVKIVDAEMPDATTSETPGTIVNMQDGIKVACAGGSVVKITFVTVNGIFVPARFADKFGFADGQRFTNNI